MDVDECAHHSGRGDCDHTCENTRGSFVCSCRPGYVLGEDKLSCIDINECEVENGGCSQKCTNSPGNFSCSCFDGFENIGKNGTDVVCSDIGECQQCRRCDTPFTNKRTCSNVIVPKIQWTLCSDSWGGLLTALLIQSITIKLLRLDLWVVRLHGFKREPFS